MDRIHASFMKSAVLSNKESPDRLTTSVCKLNNRCILTSSRSQSNNLFPILSCTNEFFANVYTGVAPNPSIPSEQESSSVPQWRLNEFSILSGTIDSKLFITQIYQNSIAVAIGLGSLKSIDI